MIFAKQKLVNYMDKKALELADQIDLSEGDEAAKLEAELGTVLDLRDKLKKPVVSKEVWVEVLKIVGLAAALGLVIWYDSNDRSLPQNVTKWIPGPRL